MKFKINEHVQVINSLREFDGKFYRGLYNPYGADSFIGKRGIIKEYAKLPGGDYCYRISLNNGQDTWWIHEDFVVQRAIFSKYMK